MSDMPSISTDAQHDDDLNAALTDEQISDAIPSEWSTTNDYTDIDLDVDATRAILHEYISDKGLHEGADNLDVVREDGEIVGNSDYNVVSLVRPSGQPIMVFGSFDFSEMLWPMMDMATIDEIGAEHDRTDDQRAFAKLLTNAVDAAGWSDDCCGDADHPCPHSYRAPVPLDEERCPEDVEMVENWVMD